MSPALQCSQRAFAGQAYDAGCKKCGSALLSCFFDGCCGRVLLALTGTGTGTRCFNRASKWRCLIAHRHQLDRFWITVGLVRRDDAYALITPGSLGAVKCGIGEDDGFL